MLHAMTIVPLLLAGLLVLESAAPALAGQPSQQRRESASVELITPDGSVYQTLTQPVESVTGTTVVETRLPVAGTWITQYDLHGRWTVNVYLDDAVKPVTSAGFTIAK